MLTFNFLLVDPLWILWKAVAYLQEKSIFILNSILSEVIYKVNNLVLYLYKLIEYQAVDFFLKKKLFVCLTLLWSYELIISHIFKLHKIFSKYSKGKTLLFKKKSDSTANVLDSPFNLGIEAWRALWNHFCYLPNIIATRILDGHFASTIFTSVCSYHALKWNSS